MKERQNSGRTALADDEEDAADDDGGRRRTKEDEERRRRRSDLGQHSVAYGGEAEEEEDAH